MNNQETNKEYREQKYMQNQAEDFYKAMGGGCMIFILLVIITIAAIFLFSGCSRLERESPTRVVYRQCTESNSQYSVYKVTSYELKETYYDTVRR